MKIYDRNLTGTSAAETGRAQETQNLNPPEQVSPPRAALTGPALTGPAFMDPTTASSFSALWAGCHAPSRPSSRFGPAGSRPWLSSTRAAIRNRIRRPPAKGWSPKPSAPDCS